MDLNPLDDLVAKYQVFRRQGGEIASMRREVSGAIYQVKQRESPDPNILAALQSQAKALELLYNEWVDANSKVQGVIGTLKSFRIPLPAGLGAVPVVLPALAIAAIAGAVTSIVIVSGKVIAQRQLLNAVKTRLLTPAEAAAIGQSAGQGIDLFGSLGGGLRSVATIAVVGLVAYFVLMRSMK